MIKNLLETSLISATNWGPELDCDLEYDYVSANLNKVWCNNRDLGLDEIESATFEEPTPERLIELMRRIPFEGDDW